jgi:hypothetical protein
LEKHLEYVNIIPVGLTIVIEEGIGPQIICILIHERMLFGINPAGIRLCKGTGTRY